MDIYTAVTLPTESKQADSGLLGHKFPVLLQPLFSIILQILSKGKSKMIKKRFSSFLICLEHIICKICINYKRLSNYDKNIPFRKVSFVHYKVSFWDFREEGNKNIIKMFQGETSFPRESRGKE